MIIDEDEGQDAAALPKHRMRQERKPRKVDSGWAMRAAAHYLERYASSTENLRRVLMRKALKRLMVDRLEGEYEAMIAQAVAKMIELGFINDATYAEQKTGSLRRRGASTMKIVAHLSAKGIEREMVREAVEADEVNDAQAALTLARRRRIGPFRRDPGDLDAMGLRKLRDKEMAILCRGGFSPALARKVIDGEIAGASDEVS